MVNPALESAARKYVECSGELGGLLGSGEDGAVWMTTKKTAVKSFERFKNYSTELECYQRLAKESISKLQGFSIPKLIGYSDALQIVEMQFVRPPYLLDFGKAHLDRPPEFSPEAWRYWEHERREMFENRWPQVRKLISSLKQFGIHYLDAKPGNIMFGDEHLAT